MEKIQGEWLTATKLADGIWWICDHGQDNMYLVVGEKKALVIDTGFGVENLAEFVKRITPLPVLTAVTHGHVDHALGNDAFDEVFAGAEDMRFSSQSPAEMRAFIRSSALLTEVSGMPKYDGAGTHARVRELPIEDGMEFDLGGRVVTAYLTPGHSRGSVCFLDKKARVLFTGDAFVPNDSWGPAWYHIGGAPLCVFYKSMQRVLDAGGFDWLCSGHGMSGLVHAESLRTFLDGIKGILDGAIAGTPEHTFAGDGLRCDWQGSSIVYDPANLL